MNYGNVELAVKGELNAIEKSTLEEWFVKLEKELAVRFTKTTYDCIGSSLGHRGFEANFVTYTGNNSGFLIQACFLIPEFVKNGAIIPLTTSESKHG